MNMTYFGYSSESEEEARGREVEPVPSEPAPRGILRHRPQKQVRFDASPEDAQSMFCTNRATEPYTGKHFIGVDTYGKQNDSAPEPAPSVQPQRPSTFIPNPFGTYKLDYDAFSSDSESSPEKSEAANAAEDESSTYQMSKVAGGTQLAIDDEPAHPSYDQMNEAARGKQRATEEPVHDSASEMSEVARGKQRATDAHPVYRPATVESEEDEPAPATQTGLSSSSGSWTQVPPNSSACLASTAPDDGTIHIP
jgi:hypothetical protein